MNPFKPCIKCGAVDRKKNGKCRPCYTLYPSRVKRKSATPPARLTKQQVSERSRQRILNWTAKNPEKNAAHIAVFKALSSKKLIKLPCFICGNKAEAHHPDYSRPLDVVWLCRTHHKETHALAL